MKNTLIQKHHLQINEKSNISCPIAQIIRLEADSNYCKVIAQNQNYYISKTLKLFSKVLPANFIRLHGKHLVNSLYIADIQDNSVIMTNSDVVSISRRKKNDVLKMIGSIAGIN